ncbi:N-6 DNA methylase [Actinoplanes sp. NBRC 103695]|uniref:N-6 DNA methylase n=1 Tax=Actinoplanes sp. NBRC 103695 TaxID=3032202 RepID=UPI0024A3F065|nr:N-6 DNA methylase [Actinoplanes sp. NBRC 103695]GLY96570.1 BseRI endonuclease [Actinoplanes sp. NBRC 103695]
MRGLLLNGDFGLVEQDVETANSELPFNRRYIDVESAAVMIGVKVNLGIEAVARESERLLTRSLDIRGRETGQRYVGVLTDGRQWHAYQQTTGALQRVASHEIDLKRPDPMALFYWLDGVLAMCRGIPATAFEVDRRLGASSTSHIIDFATLANLYHEHKESPTVKIKRQLWAQLLKSALGTQFIEDDELFIEHTLLMNSADIIAHLILGIDVLDLQPATLLSGQRFDQAGIFGVVEQDFFNWTVEVPGGTAFVQAIARRLARFDWGEVEQDILKTLYESFIGTETRRRLGEYYTPDWLAEHVVDTAVSAPLNQRVLDPACGSGTFLFHAVRKYLRAADEAALPASVALSNLATQIIGVDLHPVAVALARVTYLLAIGRRRLLDASREAINIPVYLGDSIQWRERLDLFTDEHLRISAGHGASLLEDVLRFPQSMLDDPARFDRLVSNLANLAAKPRDRNTKLSLTALLNRMAISEDDRVLVGETFDAMCRLHEEGRNHIWSYYLRNLARPLWLAMPENRVDVLVGNPPWLSYRHMPVDMQVLFKNLSTGRGLWHGGGVASHQDLSGLFSARAIQQYLRIGGTFAFVLPNAVLDRAYFRGFRSGRYSDPVEPTFVHFKRSWDLRRLRPHIFLRGSCVIFGMRVGLHGKTPPGIDTEQWTGKIPPEQTSWKSVEPHLTRASSDPGEVRAVSPYKRRFYEGATITPRALFLVDAESSDPLGLGKGRVRVKASRSNYENPPWRDLERMEGVVEVEFVRRVYLGESLIPYRLLSPRHAILPILSNELLSSDEPELHMYNGVADWWSRAEALWEQHRTSLRFNIRDRLDFQRGLTRQLPAAPLRLVYCKAGMHVAAAVVADPYAIIDHKLYWATISSVEEGDYLSAMLNSPHLTALVRPFMSYSKDERDIDKSVWNLPVPIYDADAPDHRRLAQIGKAQRLMVAGMSLPEGNFIALRRRLRAALLDHPFRDEVPRLISKVTNTLPAG